MILVLTHMTIFTLNEIKEIIIKGLAEQSFQDIHKVVEQANSYYLSRGSEFQHWYLYAKTCILKQDGKLEESINLLEKLLENQLEPTLKGRVYNSLGRAYNFNNQWDQALRSFQYAVKLHKQVGDSHKQCIALQNMSIVYRKSGEYLQALRCLEEARRILLTNPDDLRFKKSLGYVYNVMASIYHEQGQFIKAENNYLVSLQLANDCNDVWGMPFAYVNLGETYYNLRSYSKAVTHYQEAIVRFKELENERNLSYALWRLGQVYIVTQPELAQGQLLEALEVAQKVNRHEVIPDIFLDLAQLAEQQGDMAEAFAKTQEALAYAESMRANISLAGDRARMTAVRINAYEQMVRRLLLRGDIASAYYHTEMSKSRTFIEMLGQREVRQPENVPPEWLAEEQALRQELKTLYPDRANQQDKIEALETELHQVRERIRVQAVEYQSFQTATPLTLADVQARLPAGAVLVEYFAVEDNISAFVITSEQITTHTLPMTLPMLMKAFKPTGKEGELAGLHNLTRAADHRLRPAWMLKTLYQRLIEPLEEAIEKATLLCLVPHGLLHYVPFHALYKQTDTGQQYLSTPTRPMVYASSATVLLDYCQNKPLAQTEGCLAIGFDGSMLSQAEAEAQAIVQRMGGQALVGASASRQNILEKAEHYRYLHLSCHGWFNNTWPMASSLELADQPLDMSDVLRLLSLQAELVCLSACETGRSHVLKGDELIGLARAFMYAGTPSVLVSHWVVDELSTRLFMELFYEELLHCQAERSSSSTAVALSRTMNKVRTMPYHQLKEWVIAREPERAEAMLQFWADSIGLGSIEQFDGSECLLAHPYYWAAFFLLGDRLGYNEVDSDCNRKP